MEVGTLLKSKREALGLTLEDVAEAVGINKSTILYLVLSGYLDLNLAIAPA